MFPSATTLGMPHGVGLVLPAPQQRTVWSLDSAHAESASVVVPFPPPPRSTMPVSAVVPPASVTSVGDRTGEIFGAFPTTPTLWMPQQRTLTASMTQIVP